MDSARLLVTLGGGALIAFTLFFFFGEREPRSHGEPSPTPPQYRCPMHPFITSNDPGTCSICGMQLQKVDSEKRT